MSDEWETVSGPDDGWETVAKPLQKETPRPFLNPVGEAIAALGSGALAAPVSGLVGTAGAYLPGPQGQGAEWARQVQEGLTYQPRTQQGREALAAANYLPEKFAQGADWLGRVVTDATGSPKHGVAANLAPNAIALALGARGMMSKPKPVNPNITAAFDAGLKLTPTQAERGFVMRGLEGLSGTAKMEKLLSQTNSRKYTELIKQDLGISAKQNITIDALETLRGNAGNAYEAVKSSVKTIKPDKQFTADLQKLRGDFSEAVKSYPDLLKNPEVENLISSLDVPASPRAMVELTKKLRKDATANFKSYADPGKQELAFAQRNAAAALENMIDRALVSVGKKGLVSDWRKARQTIAKTYDAESALNDVTGEISAVQYGKMQKRGKPLTGNADKIARFARAFEGSAREVAKMRDTSQFSAYDSLAGMLASGGGAAAFGPFGMLAGPAGLLARPALRYGLLQGSVPPSMMPLLGSTALLPLVRQPEDR